jgi:ribonuclease-3
MIHCSTMNKISNLHNKTRDVDVEEMPFNEKNILLSEEDLRQLFDNNGLKGIQFHNINLYRNAFVHKSYCCMRNSDFVESNKKCPPNCLPLQEISYERLEFSGDSVLSNICSIYLYDRYPVQNEGFLSKLRTKLVNGKMLGYLAKEIGLDKFAIISKQVEEAGGRSNYKIMEDIFEAFLAAIFFDFQTNADIPKLPYDIDVPFMGSGFYVAQKWIIHIIENYLDLSELIMSRTNYKDMLVSHMQHHLQDQPRFFEINIITRNNTKIFNYCVKDKNNTVLGTAKANNKKDAENMASLEALKHYGISI